MLKKSINLFLYLFVFSLFSLNIYKYYNNNINYFYANYIANFSEDTKVVGAADNVFVGTVTKDLSIGKYGLGFNNFDTNFEVQVLYNIKGNLKGNIIVSHEAWYDFLGNLHVSEGSKNLEKNGIYLLATKGDNYTINSHPNGSHILTSDILDGKKDIKKFVKENIKVKEFREAYKNEVYYQIDDEGEKYKISSEKNAYKNLGEKEKNDFENIENGFVN